MPIIRRDGLHAHPRRVQRIDRVFCQRACLHHRQIHLQRRKDADAKQEAISTAVLNVLKLRVVVEPAECDFRQRQVVIVGGWLDYVECVQDRVFQVSLPIESAGGVFVTEASFVGDCRAGLVLALIDCRQRAGCRR